MIASANSCLFYFFLQKIMFINVSFTLGLVRCGLVQSTFPYVTVYPTHYFLTHLSYSGLWAVRACCSCHRVSCKVYPRHQSIAGLAVKDRQPSTLTFLPTVNLNCRHECV